MVPTIATEVKASASEETLLNFISLWGFLPNPAPERSVEQEAVRSVSE